MALSRPTHSTFGAFFATALGCGDAIAIRTGAELISYTDLSKRANMVAKNLLDAGVETGQPVAIFASRSIDAVAGILGCLQVGAIFVPMDPTFAPEHLGFIAQDLPIKAVLASPTNLTTARNVFSNVSAAVLLLDEKQLIELQPIAEVTGNDPACILYTSGTTGQPKGVVLPHRAIATMALSESPLSISADDVVLSAATIACDGALAEILVPLMVGASVALVEAETPAVHDVADTMILHGVTVALWYAGLQNLVVAHRVDAFATVRISEQGGDVMSLPMAKALLDAWPNLKLFNGYGPTETCVRSLCHEVTKADIANGEIPIGAAMPGEDVFIVDGNFNQVQDGEVGQLCIAGEAVALGYFERPNETNSAFIPDPRDGYSGLVYLTGDLARVRGDGAFLFQGRTDRQVKLAGRRVEIDGIEHILRELPIVADAVVELARSETGSPFLRAFIVPKDADLDETEFTTCVKSSVSDMIARDVYPRDVLVLAELPLAQSGKVDRQALRQLESKATQSNVAKSANDTFGIVQKIWHNILGGSKPTKRDTFFDLGGTSLQLIDAHVQIEQALSIRVPITLMFDVARIGELTEHLAKISAKTDSAETTVAAHHDLSDNHTIAIVGMAARLPGGIALDDFWNVIRDGRSVIEQFSIDEAEDAFDAKTRNSSGYVPARSILKGVDQFDPAFFGMRPKEAAITDPQGRVFLEICQEALDDAGIDPARTSAAIGVYAGSPMSTYMLENVLQDRAQIRNFTSGFQIDYAVLSGNDSADLATRVAFKLGLKGPAIAMNTACSTSLVAIAEACKSIRSGDSDVALAGGVSITFPQKRGYIFQESGMASPDGLCRPFDIDAGGTVFGHGAGVIVLKSLADAKADGDHIHAVITGVGLNNDGADKMSYTAPSMAGQAGAIKAAHRDAGISASDVGYVECHGTATPLGDPIEVAGLALAFEGSDARCALGAVKGNLGHLDAAAGVIGVIKAAAVLAEKTIPPVAHFSTLNPRIELKDTPFWVPDTASNWVSDSPRVAGVSSFGVGGTNAHVILQEAPPLSSEAEVTGPVILPLSAKMPEALAQMAQDLSDALEAQPQLSLPDAALTLQVGRREFDWRFAIAATDHSGAISQLRSATTPLQASSASAPQIVFLFPGQGSQYPGMGSELYVCEPEYAQWIDKGAAFLTPLIGRDIKPLILGHDLDPKKANAALRETRFTQPALFLTEYALAKLWSSRGINPDAYIGHSVGELTAAALSGVMSFEDALRLIAARGQLMQDCPSGSMLSVRATIEQLRPHLDETVDLAAMNAPKLQVVAGPDDAIAALEVRLAAADLPHQKLHTSHAFHSKMMDPVVDGLLSIAKTIVLRAPDRPIYSTVTGAQLSTQDACDPAFWAGQARACVDFQAAITAAHQSMSPVFVEVGPGRTLSTCSAQTLGRSGYRGCFQSLPDHARSVSDEFSMAAAVSQLWNVGVALDWSLVGPRGSRKIRLPSYPFQRQKCWIDAPEAAQAEPTLSRTLPSQESTIMPTLQSNTPAVAADRIPQLTQDICALLADMSGEDIGMAESSIGFVELGFDSLFLGQVSQAIAREYEVEIGFRRLLADVNTVDALVQHLDAEMPAAAPVQVSPTIAPTAPEGTTSQSEIGGSYSAIVQAQLQTMQAVFAQQLQAAGQAHAVTPATAALSTKGFTAIAAPEKPEPAGFKVGRGASVSGGSLTPEQIVFAQDLATKYSEKYAASKAYTSKHRAVLADPRTAAGFRSEWKELTFPIVAERSKGAYIHDLDGNDLVDLVNGFGQTAFGHSPGFVVDAVAKQMERGFPIGPQADLAGPVAQKFADVVGHERVTFCNTGSEAVMAAMRLARTVTGRDTIVVFDRDYHGQFDEVLVKGKASGGTPDALPIAPGIPRSGLKNMKVLPYGGDSALNWIKENIKDVAAIIVEPVQSRHPEHRPEEFVRDLRQVTQENGTALVIDEVVTGFRTSASGMQGIWGIQGDMATYGKVVGGGMPIGVLAGNAKFMDALDGGAWSFGDDSVPEAMPTFFAGTFVRHPLVLAAVDATLDHMAAHGDDLWEDTAVRTAALAARLSEIMTARGLPDLIETYSSWFVINVTEADPRASLLYPLMRLAGVHVMDGFCGFLTTEHNDAECEQVIAAFETSLDALLSVGILTELQGEGSAAETRSSEIPLTQSQREIWMRYQMGGLAAAAFNESGSLTLKGSLDRAALQDAWGAVVARHDALRMRFKPNGSSFEITAPTEQKIGFHDISGEAGKNAALAAIVAEDGATPFDLSNGAPIRVQLVKLSNDHHVLVITAHHIAADGWSFGVFLADFADFYSAKVSNTSVDLPAAPSFAAHAEAESLEGTDNSAISYWTETLTPSPALVDLPLDRPRPVQRSFDGSTIFHEIEGDILKKVRKAGATQGCTMFATAFAAMQMLVHRLTGADNFAIGVPVAAQQNLPNPELVGHCVNFLPLRNGVVANDTVADHLTKVKTVVQQALENQGTTFGSIIDNMDQPRSANRLPLTEIEFNYEIDKPLEPMAGLEVSFRPNIKRAVNFDLFFNLVETSMGLRIEAHFNSDLYDPETVTGWAKSYQSILEAIASDLSQSIGNIPLAITPQQDLAGILAPNKMDYDRLAALPDLITKTALAFPNAIAISDAGGSLTYAKMSAQSDALAALIQEQVPGIAKRVALCLPRTNGMLVGLLAILKAGHTYVPLDPTQPDTRLRRIVETADATAILTDDPKTVSFANDLDISTILLGSVDTGKKPKPVSISAEQAAYVIFTSGSTGTPKGVAVPHRAVVNFLTSMAQEPGFTASDTILAVTTVMFDIAVLELLLPLTVGGQVIIAPAEEVVDCFGLVERLKTGEITTMQATPTLWDMVLTAGFEPYEGFSILCGGEPLPQDLADRLQAGGATVWNMYGPTETTIWSAIKKMAPIEKVTIGKPIGNTSLIVLDNNDQPVAQGVMGELNIGGDGLAIGYDQLADMTAKAFRDVEILGKKHRLYATGDLARRTSDGEFVVAGRIDTQVKLRGFRIELGEIETRLRAISGVAKAAVDLRSRGANDQQLVGYVVTKSGVEFDRETAQSALSKNLPEYMVPNAWVVLSDLPQTGNGKLDRKALPDPQTIARITPLHEFTSAETAIEKQIMEIWQDVLGRDQISVTDTVQALGIDSLALFRIAAKMLDAGLGLEARHMFAHPTIRRLAAFHDSRDTDAAPSNRPSLKSFRKGARRTAAGDQS